MTHGYRLIDSVHLIGQTILLMSDNALNHYIMGLMVKMACKVVASSSEGFNADCFFDNFTVVLIAPGTASGSDYNKMLA